MNFLTKINHPKFKVIADVHKWVERDNEGKIIKTHDTNPKIGFTLVMAPYLPSVTYVTLPIIEFIKNTDELIHFKTEKYEYKLQLFNI